MPVGGPGTTRSRNPFPDEVAQVLADGTNLRRLADVYVPKDRGLRDGILVETEQGLFAQPRA